MKKKARYYYEGDMKRYGGGGMAYLRGFQKYLRLAHFCDNGLLKLFYKWKLKRYRNKYGLEISSTAKIGRGLYIGHPYNITINPQTTIGENCNIHKGCTIGRENRGRRKGAPTIGNKVWIGINAAIVGNVKIGDDVLIAPCSYVNCDVPSHSVVFGNPCIVKHRDNATEGYINNTI